MTAWTAHLAALDCAVLRTAAALDQDATDFDLTLPAMPAEPLPASLGEQAAAVLGRLETLVDALTAAQRRVGQELASSRRCGLDRRPTPDPRYLNSYG